MTADRVVDTAPAAEPAAPAAPAVVPAADAGQTPAAPAAAPVTAVQDNAPAAPAWPDNWRDLMAAGDDAFRKQLDRVSSPLDIAKNYRELERKKSSAPAPAPTLPENATAEQVAEYRKAVGLPESPDKYEIKLPEGFQFGEKDKPYVDMYLKTMHDRNLPTEAVNAGLNAYAAILEKQATEYVQRDMSDKRAFEDQMRSEWGNEYRTNVNIVENFISSAPADIGEMIVHGRGPDGRALLNNPEFVKWINTMAREINPAATVVPSGGDMVKTIDAELQALDDYRRANLNNGRWHNDDARRARHRELLEAKSKLEAKQKR